MMEQVILKTISRHSKDKQAIRSSQDGYTKGNSCLTNLINVFDEVTGLLDRVRAVAVVYLNCSSAYDRSPLGCGGADSEVV